MSTLPHLALRALSLTSLYEQPHLALRAASPRCTSSLTSLYEQPHLAVRAASPHSTSSLTSIPAGRTPPSAPGPALGADDK
ncbi:hypothetical protein NHX12_029199 [Muraenolepis orangiensis]|uniref:Uncharacterized protein n=1 Tax=Muraenolepis orangiensis TaxID=630683 RepID=A0A9Q0EBR2_9TELE|nr:hypothetical protein NHX12_029199 [Muraenolepis orangiensis]